MSQTQSPEAWHDIELAAVLERVRATEHGLTQAEAEARLASAGPNRLPEREPPSWLRIFLRQFDSPLIYVLGAAAVVSLGLGEHVDAAFIFAVLMINAAIGAVQEWRAERSSRALQRLLRGRAAVLRDREVVEIDAEQVVPGDVLWLESGQRVPADVRLLGSHGLEVDESLLTGESLAVPKDPAWRGEASAALGDRVNMGYAGSVVSRGRGRGVVVATGTQTMVGALARDVSAAAGGRPPLVERIERFTRVIGVAVLAAAALAAFLGVVVQGQGIGQMFLFAVAMAVSAIPEGLPVAMTVALSVAATRMSRRGVIVRRLAAVEGLGSCTLIATDKTGTLTCNELTVRRVQLPGGEAFDVSGHGYVPEGLVLADGVPVAAHGRSALDRLAQAAVLANEGHLHHRDSGWAWTGDPTDIALLAFAHKLGWRREEALESFPELDTIPFEAEHRYAATFHAGEAGVRAVVKGAPERVVEMCRWRGEADKQQALRRAAELAEEGFRVLALAEGLRGPLVPGRAPEEPEQLELLGFVGMIDPARPGVRKAIADCRKAGIGVTMITGDHPVTALAIARDLGLASEPHEVVSSAQLSGASAEELAALVRHSRVFARVSPQQKLQIVEAARHAGHFVAVTGDGVNDAPALRTANIGVAMGKNGTDVARDAAELVISDDNFATIVAGVEEGRVAYDNIRKVIYLLISTGAAEIVLILLSLMAGLPLPLLAVQLLWLNLVTNGIQDVALAFEPAESDVLRRRPRSPSERIFDRLMIERTLVGALVIGGVGFLAFRWMLGAGWSEPAARNGLLLLMVLFEIVHIGNCRSETLSLFRLSPLRSPVLLAGTVAAFGVHVLSLHLPALQAVLRTEPVDLLVWLALLGLALSVSVAMELHKLTWAWRYGPGSAADEPPGMAPAVVLVEQRKVA
jgi:P-type Ca2+ transporter type 2C